MLILYVITVGLDRLSFRDSMPFSTFYMDTIMYSYIVIWNIYRVTFTCCLDMDTTEFKIG